LLKLVQGKTNYTFEKLVDCASWSSIDEYYKLRFDL